MRLSELLDRFEDMAPDGDGWTGICPAHADSKPSLHVSVKDDGKVLYVCRAGCDSGDVLKAARLTWAEAGQVTDLEGAPTVATSAPVDSVTRGTVNAQAYGWAATLAAVAAYDDSVGAVLRDRFGIAPETLTQEQCEELGIGLDDGRLMVVARTADGAPAFVQGRALDPADPVRWKGLANAPDGARWDSAGRVGRWADDRPVLVCEGPSDALTAAVLNVVDVVAIRGAQQAARVSEVADSLRGKVVYVAGDGDSAGRGFNLRIAAELKDIAKAVMLVPMPDGKDLGDVRQDDPAGFSAALEDLLGKAEESEQETAQEHVSTSTKDVHVGARVATEHLRGSFVSWGRSAWSHWDGKRWARCTDTTVFEAIRQAVLQIHKHETAAARDAHARATAAAHQIEDPDKQPEAIRVANKALTDRMKELAALFNVSKLQAIMRVARGLVEVDAACFDTKRDHLNVANGVLDLRTGELQPHDPEFLFTKVSPTAYRPGAVHTDWDKALTALPADVGEWMRDRFGQAATGYSTSDDVVPFLRGGGENGKSSVMAGVIGALGSSQDGGFSTLVPDKVLLGNTNDHPTEMMDLMGARFAYIEELPEGDYLNAQRLKKIAGTQSITARYIGQDNITWTATHSLFVTTNYEVKIDAVDNGTWRRLALVMFPYTYNGTDPSRPKDPTLRERIQYGREGQHEAALAWLVEGAKRWYANGRVMPAAPAEVRRDTGEWKSVANQAIRFLDEAYELSSDHAVPSKEVYEAFTQWAEAHGIRKWGDQLFWSRAKQHDWFASGDAQKPTSVVRTSAWKVDSRDPGYVRERERLVTGIRRVTGAGDVEQGPGILGSAN